MDHPVNGAAVDLAQVKAAADQRAAIEAHREQLEAQLLTQAGLACPCGQRIRDKAVIYFAIAETMVPTPTGPAPALNLVAVTCCSRHCPAALANEAGALARRDGPAGPVVWLDERRAARALRQDHH